MASTELPISLKGIQLKHLAFLIGLPTTGTKSAMKKLLHRQLEAPVLLSKPTRIVSIDMGIKNLGLCALKVPAITKTMNEGQKLGLTVLDWKKVNLLANLPDSHDTTAAEETEELEEKRAVGATAFSPSSLSKAAFNLTRDILDTYKPDHILIERQRFRSGGAAAVQEWTLRVNMLESMIWACLTTLRSTKGYKPGLSMHEVSPARVAKFWCLGADTKVPVDILANEDWKGEAATGAEGRVKVTKIDKIATARKWLTQYDDFNAVDLKISEQARPVVQALKRQTEGQPKKKDKKTYGKLDDLADCLLQGAAWIRWEENRQRILRLLASTSVVDTSDG